VLIACVKRVKAAKHHIEEVYWSFFPVHGLDKAMGLAPTRIAINPLCMDVFGLAVIHCDDELIS